MRIAAFIESSLTAGGGFIQGLNAILSIRSVCEGKHEVLTFTSRPTNVSVLAGLGITARLASPGWKDRLAALSAASPIFRVLQRKLRFSGNLERAFKKHRIDLVYFVDPGITPLYLQELNYIATVWDICHVDHPEFPEVRAYGEFRAREFALRNTLPQAVSVICDSRALAESLARRYGLDAIRLISMPFSPSPFSSMDLAAKSEVVLAKYGLERQSYYFYPAQLWPHKNHVRILQALAELRRRGLGRVAAFSGKDYGNLTLLRDTARELGVEDLVRFLGFVPAEDIRGLYEGAFAVVMPTYFGPTNIPPLEAWDVGTPLVYSEHLSEQAGDAALLVDPGSTRSLLDGLLQLEVPEVRESLVARGRERLKRVLEERSRAQGELQIALDGYSRKLACWKPEYAARG